MLSPLLAGVALTAQVPPPPDAAEVLADAYQGKSYSPYATTGSRMGVQGSDRR